MRTLTLLLFGGCFAAVVAISVRIHAQEPLAVDGGVGAEVVVPAGVTLPPGVPTIPPGQEVEYGSKMLAKIMDLVSAKRWGALVGVVLMVAVAVFLRIFVWSKELREKVRDYMPEVIVGVSVLGAVGVALSSLPAGASWWPVVGPAIVIGGLAIGGWEFLVKRVLLFWWPKLWSLIKRLFAKKETA